MSDDGAQRPAMNTPPCPSCGARFVLGTPRCKACGLVLTGPLAVRLWQIDLDLEALEARRAEALDALRTASRPGASATAMTQPYADLRPPGPGAPVAGGGESAAPVVPPVGGGATQHLLLGLGVLLLFVASVVFFAVAWDALGVYGRMAALLVAIAACVALASYCSARALSASAEAFAILGVGLTGVGLTAAYALDLFGLGGLSLRGWATGSAVLVCAVTAAAHLTARAVSAYPLVALVAAWVAPLAAFADERVANWSVGLACGWLVLASPLLRWARRLADPADGLAGASRAVWAAHGGSALSPWAPLWQPALASGVLAGVAATGVLASNRAGATSLLIAGGVVVVGLAVVGQALRVGRPLAAMPREVSRVAAAFWFVLGAETAALVRNTGVWASAVWAALALVALVILLCVRSERTRSWSLPAGLVAAGSGLASVALVVLTGAEGASAWVLALLATGSAALAVAERAWRVRAEVVGCVSGLAALAYAVVALEAGMTAAATTATVAGVLLAALAALRRRVAAEETVFGTAAFAAFGAGVLLAWVQVDEDGGSFAFAVLTVVFAVAAVTTAAYAALPRRGFLLVAAVPLGIATVWTQLADGEVDAIEAYTLTAALVCAVAGLAVRRRDANASSWVVVGPAVAFALLPSAVVASSSGSGMRLLYVLAVGTAVVLGGVRLRWRAPVTVGAIALGLVAVQELFLLLVELPPTLGITICGVVLVAAGVRYERNVRDLRSVGAWLDAMT